MTTIGMNPREPNLAPALPTLFLRWDSGEELPLLPPDRLPGELDRLVGLGQTILITLAELLAARARLNTLPESVKDRALFEIRDLSRTFERLLVELRTSQ